MNPTPVSGLIETIMSIYYYFKRKVKEMSYLAYFGICVTNIVKASYDIDRKSGNDILTKRIAKEIANVHILFNNVDYVSPENTR